MIILFLIEKNIIFQNKNVNETRNFLVKIDKKICWTS